jgi:hypothetical protein
MSLTYDHKTYITEVSSHFETYLSDLLCVMTYYFVYSRRLGSHVLNVVDETIGHHTEEVRKTGFKVRSHLSGVSLVVIGQRYLSRGLPVFVNK